jgi:uroporphyrin-III C-methyltransferase
MPPETLPGVVQLVGAGPGPTDLMTVRAQRALANAQAVLYDALVDPEVLSLAPAACLKIRTGKRSGQASLSQGAINALMLKLARRGLRVVRLKGGDPSIFGRSGEEKAYLEAHGVAVEVIPGVTAASAAAAQFGFPLTHRGQARRLVFATARTQDGRLVDDGWASLADGEATLALYMARDAAPEVCAAVMAAGRPPDTPAAAIENAGRPEARLIRSDLRHLARDLEAMACSGPVLILVGEVANLARSRQEPDAWAQRSAPVMHRMAPSLVSNL